ncbi:MAG TPA: sensor histidine kinase [Bryobacteraceae bacterium]|nr:sensor histidine kinase [Bryobacteraceae bacterium]
MTDPLATAAAQRYVTRMAKAIRPYADRFDRCFRALIRARGYDAPQARAFLAITPSAASRVRPLRRFLEQVAYNSRRLAKLNVQPGEVKEALRECGKLLDSVLEGRFQPAREQLYLATVLALNEAFFQVREAEAQAFFGLYRAEIEARGLDDLLQRFVRILTHTFRARAGRLLLLNRPVAGKLAQPLYIERGQSHELLIASPEMRGRHASYWSFPMPPSALLQLGFATRYPWLPREMALLDAIAERCREAIEKARMRAEIQRLEAEARRAEESERRRIGRELHDEAGQSLLLLRLQLEMMERAAPAELRPHLAEARENAERTVEELRRIVAALSPAVLERLGLEAAIRQSVARFRKMHPAHVRVRISGPLRELSGPVQEVIYRVAQESLQNIAKHSQATHVNLSVHSTDKTIRLSVSDNGAGFSAETAESKPMSFGLAGMRERTVLLGGKLAVDSAPGKGVKVVLVLPQASAMVTHDDENSRSVD